MQVSLFSNKLATSAYSASTYSVGQKGRAFLESTSKIPPTDTRKLENQNNLKPNDDAAIVNLSSAAKTYLDFNRI